MVRALLGGLGSRHAITGLLVLMSVLVIANAALGAIGSYLLERTAESVVLRAAATWSLGCCTCASPRSTGPSPAT